MSDGRSCSHLRTTPGARVYLRWRKRLAAPEDKAGRQEVLAPDKEAGQPEVFALEDKDDRPEVLAPEDKACWQKVLTLEEEAFVQTFWQMRPAGQRCSRKRDVICVHGQKERQKSLLTTNRTKNRIQNRI